MSLAENKIIQLGRRGDVLLSEIKFSEGNDNPDVQVLRKGAFDHPYYGMFVISEQVLAEMVQNFTLNIRRQDMAFDYFHRSEEEASGWVENLELRNAGTELWAKVKWTPKAKQMMKDKEVRYFSADFSFEWTDPESKITYKNVLFGGGLVNRPFVKDMQPVVGLNERGGNLEMKTVEQLNNEIKELSEKHAVELKEVTENVAKLQEDNKKLLGEISEMNKAKALSEKEAAFSKLLTEGKACVAQKEAYMSGDMVKFAELFTPTNVIAKGNGDEGNTSKLSADEKAICEKLGLTESEYLAAN